MNYKTYKLKGMSVKYSRQILIEGMFSRWKNTISWKKIYWMGMVERPTWINHDFTFVM